MNEKILLGLLEAHVKVGNETIRELQIMNSEMKGIHSDTSELKGYFNNGFKKEIVDSVTKSTEKIGDKLTRNTMALIGLAAAISTLTVFIVNMLVR